jgi:hypothetical protein
MKRKTRLFGTDLKFISQVWDAENGARPSVEVKAMAKITKQTAQTRRMVVSGNRLLIAAVQARESRSMRGMMRRAMASRPRWYINVYGNTYRNWAMIPVIMAVERRVQSQRYVDNMI